MISHASLEILPASYRPGDLDSLRSGHKCLGTTAERNIPLGFGAELLLRGRGSRAPGNAVAIAVHLARYAARLGSEWSPAGKVCRHDGELLTHRRRTQHEVLALAREGTRSLEAWDR